MSPLLQMFLELESGASAWRAGRELFLLGGRSAGVEVVVGVRLSEPGQGFGAERRRHQTDSRSPTAGEGR